MIGPVIADAFVYSIEHDGDDMRMKIAFPNALFDGPVSARQVVMRKALTLSIGGSQGMEGVDYGMTYAIYFPPAILSLIDDPVGCVRAWWGPLGRDTSDGGLMVGALTRLQNPCGHDGRDNGYDFDRIRAHKIAERFTMCMQTACIGAIGGHDHPVDINQESRFYIIASP